MVCDDAKLPAHPCCCRLHKEDFHKSGKTPRMYVGEPFHLDGCIDLDVSFNERAMKTVVYVKMDAQDQLSLSEATQTNSSPPIIVVSAVVSITPFTGTP